MFCYTTFIFFYDTSYVCPVGVEVADEWCKGVTVII